MTTVCLQLQSNAMQWPFNFFYDDGNGILDMMQVRTKDWVLCNNAGHYKEKKTCLLYNYTPGIK